MAATADLSVCFGVPCGYCLSRALTPYRGSGSFGGCACASTAAPNTITAANAVRIVRHLQEPVTLLYPVALNGATPPANLLEPEDRTSEGRDQKAETPGILQFCPLSSDVLSSLVLTLIGDFGVYL